MKFKVIFFIVATVLMIGGSIGETLYIEKTFNDFEQKLEEQMNKSEYSPEEIDGLNKWWIKKAEVLEIFISVLQLNEITVTMGELTGAIKTGDHDSAKALFNRIYQYAIRINDMYMLKLNNIF